MHKTTYYCDVCGQECQHGIKDIEPSSEHEIEIQILHFQVVKTPMIGAASELKDVCPQCLSKLLRQKAEEVLY